VATSGPPSPLHTSNSPPVSSSLTSTTENPNPPSAIVDHGTTEPHFVSTITTSPFASVPPRSITTTTTQPPIPHPSHVNRLRERSPHDLHSERSHYDERTRHLSPRFDDPNDRYPPRRQYPRDRRYIRPTTTVNTRPHAIVHPLISLVLAHLALPTPPPQRHTAATGTTLHPREIPRIHRSPQTNLPRLHPQSARRKQPYYSPQLHRTLGQPPSARNYPPPTSRR